MNSELYQALSRVLGEQSSTVVEVKVTRGGNGQLNLTFTAPVVVPIFAQEAPQASNSKIPVSAPTSGDPPPFGPSPSSGDPPQTEMNLSSAEKPPTQKLEPEGLDSFEGLRV